MEPLPAPLKVLRPAHRRFHRAPHRGGGPRRRRDGTDGEPPAGRRVGWLRRGCLPAVAEEVQEWPPPVWWSPRRLATGRLSVVLLWGCDITSVPVGSGACRGAALEATTLAGAPASVTIPGVIRVRQCRCRWIHSRPQRLRTQPADSPPALQRQSMVIETNLYKTFRKHAASRIPETE